MHVQLKQMISGQLCYPFFYAGEDTAISELFINEQIRDKEVRVVGENGEQLGIMSSREALQMAEEIGRAHV